VSTTSRWSKIGAAESARALLEYCGPAVSRSSACASTKTTRAVAHRQFRAGTPTDLSRWTGAVGVTTKPWLEPLKTALGPGAGRLSGGTGKRRTRNLTADSTKTRGEPKCNAVDPEKLARAPGVPRSTPRPHNPIAPCANRRCHHGSDARCPRSGGHDSAGGGSS